MKKDKSLMMRSIMATLILILVISCKNRPTILDPIAQEVTESEWNIPSDEATQHEVVVNDILQASKYTYLNVAEDGKSYWIAIPRAEVQQGKTYYYSGGLKMENFKSKEHDRVFEELFLVSGLKSDGIQTSADQGLNVSPASVNKVSPQDITPVEGGVSLKDLFADPDKYSGSKIMIKGKCVKVNNHIMGRNWIHLQDGSEGENGSVLDLTVTTGEEVSIGDVLTVEGTITLNKDFGAGYQYDLIMEDARVIK